MILNSFMAIIKLFVEFLKYPFYIIVSLIVLFVVLCSFWFCVRLSQGQRLKKGSRRFLKQPNIFKKLLVDMPRRYVDDIFERPADFFTYQGLVIFEGRQGER